MNVSTSFGVMVNCLLERLTGSTISYSKILSVILSISFFIPLKAQELQFEQIPNELGLSQGLISCMVQDHEGFLWVGTKDGLNRFDGYSFKVFRNDPFDSTSISDNYIKSIYEDQDGRLWVGTLNGLNLFDRQKEAFLRVLSGTPASNSLSHPEINDITQASNGDLWISTNGGGLNRLSMTRQGMEFDHLNKSDGLRHDVVGYVIEDSSGRLWVKEEEEVQIIDIDPATGEYKIEDFDFTRFSESWRNEAERMVIRDKEGQGNADDRIYNFFKARDGGIWFSTAPGFVKWHPKQRVMSYLPAIYPEQRLDNVLSGTNYGKGLEDAQGRLWVHGLDALVVFDKTKRQFIGAYHSKTGKLSGKFYPAVPSAIEGNAGTIWIGTNGYGLFKYLHNRTRFAHLQFDGIPSSKRSIRSIFPYSEQELLFSVSNFDFYYYHRERQQIQAILGDETLPDTRLLVFDVIRDNTDTVWIGGKDGLFQLREQDGRFFYTKISDFQLDREAPITPAPNVFKLKAIGQDKIWLITSTHFGYFDRTTREMVIAPYLANKFGPKNLNNFPCFVQENDGSFWLGSVDGIKHFDPETHTFTAFNNDPNDPHSLSHNVVRCILPDPTQDSILWVGTAGGGLNRFNKITHRFKHYKIENGLPDNVIYGILSDQSGFLWMSTNQGLCRFDPVGGTIRNYDVHDGLQDNEFNSLAYAKSDDGEFFFGGINGLNAFYPELIKDNSFAPACVITDFQLFNKSVNFKDPDAPLQKPISEAEEVVLNYRDKVFSFQFAGLDFSNPDNIQYAYMLENFDKDWQYIGTQRTATFTNLNPGEYNFRVKSTNSDGIWSEREASVKIIIRPPWYLTSWALFAFAVIFIWALISWYRFNLSRQLMKREAEKLKEMDTLKNRLYTNITHEIRTPLTVISGMTDVFKDSNNPKHQKAVELIKRNSENLLRLVNQIMDLSKLEAGKLELQLTRNDLVGYLRYLIESFYSTAETKEVTLNFDAKVEELVMDFDEEKIQYIITNLLSNALKFTPPKGTVTLKVDIEELDHGTFVKLTVKDTGVGIAKADLPFIFDRYYQTESSSRSGEGTGIGLALTKELVQLMNSTIEVHSVEGEGSEFIVFLPLDENRAVITRATRWIKERVQQQNEQESVFSESIPAASPHHVLPYLLVIEDNADVVTYLQNCLEKGYRVSVARNGREGIRMAMEQIPDIIICDVMMPEKNGFEVTETLKQDERTSHIPIVLLTAKAASDDRLEGLKTGADAYLVKPFQREELLIRLEKLVELRHKLQEYYSSYRPSGNRPRKKELSPDERFLEKVHKIVNEKMDDAELSPRDLYQELHLSQAQLYRKLKALTGKTPAIFIRGIRLQRGMDLLKTTNLNISEVAYQIGFNDPNYFTRIFSKEMGILPSAVRKEQEG